jgi:hypothetical protein
MLQKKYDRSAPREPFPLGFSAALCCAALGILGLVANLAEHPSPKRLGIELGRWVPLAGWFAWRKRSGISRTNV